jgi:hypothetical protein
VEDADFESWVAGELASLPSVLAVTLGGSRGQGWHHAGSDWDFAVYYRGRFDPAWLRAKGWSGQVFDIGAWGGGVMNGGAWLTIDGRPVDVHYRDLNQVEHWCAEAEAGRFVKEYLPFYVAGIPTYVVMAELALHAVLVGTLPAPEYPDALAEAAGLQWRGDALASLAYASAGLRRRGDTAVGLANAARGLIEAAHSRLAERREWVLNEKGMASRAGLAGQADLLLAATDHEQLLEAIDSLAGRLER